MTLRQAFTIWAAVPHNTVLAELGRRGYEGELRYTATVTIGRRSGEIQEKEGL